MNNDTTEINPSGEHQGSFAIITYLMPYVGSVCDWPVAWPVHGAAAPAASPGVSALPPADAWCTPVNQNKATQPLLSVGIQRDQVMSRNTMLSYTFHCRFWCEWSSHSNNNFQVSQETLKALNLFTIVNNVSAVQPYSLTAEGSGKDIVSFLPLHSFISIQVKIHGKSVHSNCRVT